MTFHTANAFDTVCRLDRDDTLDEVSQNNKQKVATGLLLDKLHEQDTESRDKTERERDQRNSRLSAHQSATSATQDLNKDSTLCDSQKYTTCLDVHYSAYHRNERDEDLLFVCLPPLLCPR